MVEVASKFETGVEAMRCRAIDIVNGWHEAKWNDQPSLSNAEVHQILICIVGDIRVATVPGN